MGDENTAKLQKITHICKKNTLKTKKNAKKFGHVKKKQYFCTRFSKKQQSAWFPRDVNQRSVCRPKSVAQNIGVIERRGRESRGVLMQARCHSSVGRAKD